MSVDLSENDSLKRRLNRDTTLKASSFYNETYMEHICAHRVAVSSYKEFLDTNREAGEDMSLITEVAIASHVCLFRHNNALNKLGMFFGTQLKKTKG